MIILWLRDAPSIQKKQVLLLMTRKRLLATKIFFSEVMSYPIHCKVKSSRLIATENLLPESQMSNRRSFQGLQRAKRVVEAIAKTLNMPKSPLSIEAKTILQNLSN